jgi:lipoate-protein ligase A
MAVDEAILEAIGRSSALPTLRFYGWDPPCLSLGYAQSLDDVDLVALEELGWDLVRRPTGGRAILHADELTYSVIGPQNEPRLSGGVLESYCNLSKALLTGLHALNIPAEAVEMDRASTRESAKTGSQKNQNPVCFEVPSNYEITLGGKKLIGSAQARRKDGVLQHGTLPLTGDLTRIIQVLQFPEEDTSLRAARRLLERATTVESGTGQKLEWQQVAESIARAFCEELSLQFIRGELSNWEIERARELSAEKYNGISWTGKT